MNHHFEIARFALAVRAAAFSQDREIRASASQYGTTYSGPGGGYAVPSDFIEDIFMRDETALLPYCDGVPVTSGSVGIPTDGTVPWESSGIKCAWIEEGEAGSESKPHLDLQQFKLKKLLALVPLTEELVDDAGAIAAWLPRALSRAATWEVNKALIQGTGAGVPLGMLNSSALITQTKETGQAANTIIEANIARMMSRCLDPFSARWIMNPDALSQVLQLDLYDGPTKTLAGLPITATEAAPALGSKGDITLANLAGYRVASRGEQLLSSSHLWFDSGLVAFRLTTRMDGAPILAKPTTPPNSSNTRSHFVTLEART
ncbi:MAG: phage major capsid protein [Pseudomonadota bacterium]